MEKILLKETDRAFIRDDNEDGIGCGSVNEDGHLYLIDNNKHEAYRLPDKYKDTPIILYHPCGGYQEGLNSLPFPIQIAVVSTKKNVSAQNGLSES